MAIGSRTMVIPGIGVALPVGDRGIGMVIVP
jgi:hypothetical protein